jgi:hypothetical protein
MNLRLLACIGLLVILTPAWGCRKAKDAEPPVAKASLSISRTRAALGSPVELTYQFVVAPGAPRFAHNYRVFVHFLDADQELMWTDDHFPPVSTTQWKPGETIRYTRTRFVPVYPYVGEASVVLGLYGGPSGARMPLEGTDQGHREYKVATLSLLPQTENVFLIYREGWHPVEVASDSAGVEWQWTRKEAAIAFRNPRRDLTFYLHVGGRPTLLPEPQVVSVRIGDVVLDSFRLDSLEEVVRKVPVTAAQLGAGDMVEIRIGVDRTFIPALVPGSNSKDPRELGLRVFHAFVEPR